MCARPRQVEKLVRAACDKFGGLDIMFNNAGIGVTSSLIDHTEETLLEHAFASISTAFSGASSSAAK